MTWVEIPADSAFGPANLPYGVFAPAGGPPRAGVRLGDQVYPGMVFMKVVDLSSMQVDAAISQAESEMVRLGQSQHRGLG